MFLHCRCLDCLWQCQCWSHHLPFHLRGTSIPISFGRSHLHPTSLGHLMGMPASLKTGAASWRAAVDGHTPKLPLWVGQVLTRTQ